MKRSSFLKGAILGALACGALVHAAAADAVTLKFWLWNMPFERVSDVLGRFEQQNPGIKIEYTNLESKNFQEKVPLAISTGEDLDLVGVQAGAFGNSIKDGLADIEPLMSKYIGAEWAKGYSKLDIDTSKATTSGSLKFVQRQGWLDRRRDHADDHGPDERLLQPVAI